MSSTNLSVIMPVYNAENYLSEAIDSVLGQTFKDFEFIIIDDGSKDKSPKILKDYAARDKRIKLIAQENRGLVKSLNRGIKAAKGTYIARHDNDDKSAPERFNREIDFLQAHPDIVIVGSSVNVMDNKSQIIHQHAVLLQDPEIRQELLLRSPFAHGSVMFKRQTAIDAGLYDQHSELAEDYDLWLRMSKFGQLANLDEYLYCYREHDQGMSAINKHLQLQRQEEVRKKAWHERERLLPKRRINLRTYKNLDMGQLRIERIIDNSVFVSKQAWRHNQKTLAFKNLSMLAGDKITYKKTAGKIRRKIGSK